MIVQELRAIQDARGYLPAEELRALSKRKGVPLYRLHEVASFFPHYRLQRGAEVEVAVCRDLACHLRDAGGLCARMRRAAQEVGGDRIAVAEVSCLGQCDRGPAATINHQVLCGLSQQQWDAQVQRALAGQTPAAEVADRSPCGWSIDPYHGAGRYDAVRGLKQDAGCRALLEELRIADLRGMGGAGFPAFRKWEAVRDAGSDEKYVICNADESEPGMFKDRELLRSAPYLVLEGMVAAGRVTGAKKGYIYIRHEYQDEIAALQAALEAARGEGIFGSFEVEIFISPGGYICGEETALLEAMEDRRAEPRNKPPYPVTRGLYGKPTVINNVETLAWVPAIALRGGAWYRDQGIGGATGLRLVSVSGDVVSPGVYEVPFGLSVGELIAQAGGMREGLQLQAIAPSGPSSGFLPAVADRANLPDLFVARHLGDGAADYDMHELPLDLASVREIGSMLGGAFIVVGDRACMVDVALNCTRFFRNESCGKCVPCREGSQQLARILSGMSRGEAAHPEAPALVEELAETLALTSICGLGMVAANPMTTLMRHFRPVFESHLRGQCAAGVCNA